jgi:AraC family transcriptional regulator
MSQILPVVRDIAVGEGWRVRDVECHAKVGEPAFEELHERHLIAVVKHGFFNYHGRHGKTMMHGSSILLGNRGSCYACGHDHSDGDHCVALQLEDTLYAEIAATAVGKMDFQFPSSQLVLTPKLFAAAAYFNKAIRKNDALLRDETVFRYVEAVLTAAANLTVLPKSPQHSARRLSDVLHIIEGKASETLTLQDMAEIVGLSRYHFLRVFKNTVGMTPHQFVMRSRLKIAIELLMTTKMPVVDVALTSGFGDLSTFNKTFKAHTGMTPRMMRH